MQLVPFIHAIGSLGIFPSRAFIPAFVTALLLRFGPQVPYIADTGLLASVQGAPGWFTHDVTLVILALLSFAECGLDKDPSFRQMIDQFSPYVKPTMSFLTHMGVLSAVDVEVVKAIQEAGIGDAIFGIAASGGVYFFATIRQQFYELLIEMDDDDSLGIQGFFSWIEDSWAVIGVILLVILPIVMLLLTGIAFFVLYLIRKKLEAQELNKLVSCTSCGKDIPPAAQVCGYCKTPNSEPCTIGFFGQSKSEEPAGSDHDLLLIEKKRCPDCANHLTENCLYQTCSTCGHQLFKDPETLKRYINRIDGRRNKVLGICLVSGLCLYIFAVIPAAIYYRFQLVSPYRRYVSSWKGIMNRWLIGLAKCFLFLLIGIPFLAGISLPLMAGISYTVFRKAFHEQIQAKTDS